MTPLQFATEECANHQPNGSCLGVVIADDLSARACNPKPRCIIATGQRCPYFEECVSPLADMVSDSRRAAELQKAVAEYRKVTNQGGLTRTCPECGGLMQPRKRYCPVCADKRRKEATRQAVAKFRMSCKQLSQNTPSFS